MESDIYASIYPLSETHINRFFNDNKKTFLKYLPHESTMLNKNHKLLFYRSRRDKKIMGEGVINKIEFLLPSEILDRYKNEIFLTKKELFDYVGIRNNKKMITIHLKNIIKYNEPIMSKHPITMAGRYISKKEYDEMFK